MTIFMLAIAICGMAAASSAFGIAVRNGWYGCALFSVCNAAINLILFCYRAFKASP